MFINKSSILLFSPFLKFIIFFINLNDLCCLVVENNADLGFVVDPDVDRLAIVSEDGSLFGEEYTLVACADYVLNKLTN